MPQIHALSLEDFSFNDFPRKNRQLKLKSHFRHGESEMNVKKIIGGNGNLSPNGRAYGAALGDFIKERIDTDRTRFITSTLQRTLQTASLAKVNYLEFC